MKNITVLISQLKQLLPLPERVNKLRDLNFKSLAHIVCSTV